MTERTTGILLSLPYLVDVLTGIFTGRLAYSIFKEDDAIERVRLSSFYLIFRLVLMTQMKENQYWQTITTNPTAISAVSALRTLIIWSF
jgi:hypothetical protein